MIITNSKFIFNTAMSYGGAIDNAGELTIINSLFDHNEAYGAGAIDNGGNLKIINRINKFDFFEFHTSNYLLVF